MTSRTARTASRAPGRRSPPARTREREAFLLVERTARDLRQRVGALLRPSGISTAKYNVLVDANTPFTSFKLFYGWDEPLMTPAQALGVDGTEHTDFIEITPNMIQYQ